MPKRCSICIHKKRLDIEEAILSGEALRLIGNRFGVSADALSRHKRYHIRQSLIKAQEAREIVLGGSLLDQLKSLQQKALELLAKSEAEGDYRGALAGVVAARGTLEVLVDIMDRLKENPPIQQQVISFGSAEIGGAIEALLASRVITLSEGEPEAERQDSVTIEDSEMDTSPVDLSSEPPIQIG